MCLKHLVRVGLVALAMLGLAACDGSENARTQPTAGPDYVSPSNIGPAIAEDHGPNEDESHGEGESEGASEDESTGEEEPTATTSDY